MLIRKTDLIQLSLAGATIASLFLTLWLGSKAVLGFLAFGLLLSGLYTNAVIYSIRRNTLLFLFPAWAAVTIFWAEYPMLALRLDIQLVLSFIIFITLACVVPLDRILEITCLFFAMALASVLLSSKTVEIYQTGEIVRVGVLGSKNNVSLVGAAALAAGAMLLFSDQKSSFGRVVALAAIATSIASIVQAKSLGTFLSVTFCAGLAFLIWNLQKLIKQDSLRSLTVYVSLFAVVMLILSTILMFNYESYVALMQAIGKDPTITGRTFIWSIGLRIIEENFWGGVGFNSFWSPRNSDAVLIWISGSREIGAAYSFHNLYINTWVELGFPGFLIVCAIVVKMLAMTVNYARNGCTAQQAAAVAFAIFLIVKSFFEVTFFSPFSINTLFFFVIWVVLNNTNLRQLREAPTFRSVRRQQKTAPYAASPCNS